MMRLFSTVGSFLLHYCWAVGQEFLFEEIKRDTANEFEDIYQREQDLRQSKDQALDLPEMCSPIYEHVSIQPSLQQEFLSYLATRLHIDLVTISCPKLFKACF